MDDSLFQYETTTYLGRREKVAVVFVGNEPMSLGLSDTRSCAQSVEHCRYTLKNLGMERAQAEQLAAGLQQFCRDITGFKEGFYSKENPNGVKRDKPKLRMWRKQYF